MKNLRLLITLLAVVGLIAACSQQSAEESSTPQDDQSSETMVDDAADNQDDSYVEESVNEKNEDKQTADTRQEPKEEKPEVYNPPPTKTVMLPESTLIAIVLVDSIDTDLHVTGQEFMAELKEPIVADGEMLFERGDKVKGVLDNVVESGRMKTPAELTFSIVSIINSKGEEFAIDTYPIEEKKDSHTKKQVGLIGGGAIVGGVIGKLTGKKGGTEIGAAAGAAAGTAAAAATGKQDIVHSAGTEVVFALRTPLKVTVTTGGPFTSND